MRRDCPKSQAPGRLDLQKPFLRCRTTCFLFGVPVLISCFLTDACHLQVPKCSRWAKDVPDIIAGAGSENTLKATKAAVAVYHGWQVAVYGDDTDIAALPTDVWITRLERFASQVSCN